MSQNAERKIVTLFGHPLGHSLSPQLHNRAFEIQGIDFEYVKRDVLAADLPGALAQLRETGYAGANITVPYKRVAIEHVDHLSDVAAAVGAINTIVSIRRGKKTLLVGDNTDVAGFLQPLARYAEAIARSPVLVLGAGGAARAVVHALASQLKPNRITVAARRPKQVSGMRTLAPDILAVDWLRASEMAQTAGLIVNTTPVGMWPNSMQSPLPDYTFVPGQIIYDVVYNPATTRLLADARHHGAIAIEGLDMFLGQAAAAYRQWTGIDMPTETLRPYLGELLSAQISS